MELDSLGEFYYEKKINGMDFSEIRRELKSKGLDESDVRSVVSSIDERLLNSVRKKEKVSFVNATWIIGVILLFCGAAITLGTYTGRIQIGNRFIFAYGPILGGLAMMTASRSIHKNKFESSRRMKR